MRNGRDNGFNYWKLDYKGKFIRTLWTIPFGVLAIILLLITDVSTRITIMLSVLLLIVLIIQLIYTYVKWKKETYS